MYTHAVYVTLDYQISSMPYRIFLNVVLQEKERIYKAPRKGQDKKAIQNVATTTKYSYSDDDDGDELEQSGYEQEESDTENFHEELSNYERERAKRIVRNKKFEYYANCKTLKANSKKCKTNH